MDYRYSIAGIMLEFCNVHPRTHVSGHIGVPNIFDGILDVFVIKECLYNAMARREGHGVLAVFCIKRHDFCINAKPVRGA